MTTRALHILLVLVLLVSVATPLHAGTENSLHPLDPLSENEIKAAAITLKAYAAFPKEALFSTIVLNEPPKKEVLEFKPGMPFRRDAFAVVMDRVNNRVFEAIVDLKGSRIASWK